MRLWQRSWFQYGIYCAVFGVTIAIYLFGFPGEALFMAVVASGGGITGAFFWKILVEGNEQSRFRTALAGVLTGLLSHATALTLLNLVIAISDQNLGQSLLSPILGPILAVFVLMAFGGWFTIPVAVALAFLVRHQELRARHQSRPRVVRE